MIRATTLVLMITCFVTWPLAGQTVSSGDPVEARLWVDGDDEPVVQRGEHVRIGYRTSVDAYSALFRIDTDGRITLLHPSTPWQDGWARGGRDHRLLLQQSPFWTVTDDPGVGYFFLVSSPDPLDLSAFDYDRAYGWDLSPVGTVIYDDPYVAMDDFVAALIPSWETVPYGLDFVTYHVGAARSYPRFLCYDCHTARDFSDWNPYAEVCSEYRIVVYDDPYYHPAFRYSGTRTVYPQPLPNRPRYALATRVAGDAWKPIVRTRPAPHRPVAFKEEPSAGSRPGSPERRPTTVSAGSGVRGTSASSRVRAREPVRRGAGNREVPAATRSTVREPSTSQPARARSSSPPARAQRPAARAPDATPARRAVPASPGRTARSRPAVTPPSRPSAAPRSRPSAATTRPSPAARPAPARRPAAGSRPTGSPSRPARAVRPPARSSAPGPRPRGRPGGGPGGSS